MKKYSAIGFEKDKVYLIRCKVGNVRPNHIMKMQRQLWKLGIKTVAVLVHDRGDVTVQEHKMEKKP